MKFLAIALVAACSRTPSPIPDVKVYGALREMIHDGRIEARVALTNVVAPSTYGLGALAGMRGEVTIVDGAPWVAIGLVDDGRASVNRDESAALLVLAKVPAWRDVRIDTDIAFADLDARIETYIRANGVSIEQPVPFVVTGVVDASWHVLKGPPSPGANPHDHARNAIVGKHAGPATVVGFFSKKHQGVFTHMGQNVHAHLVDTASSVAGHADELAIRAGSILRLPAR